VRRHAAKGIFQHADRIDDVRPVVEHHVALDARREAMPWLPEPHTDEETRAWAADIALPNQEVWVAEVDDRGVGYAARDGVELNDLYVRPGWQGRGVGGALLRRAMDESSGELSLRTFQRNAVVRRFYERRGFVAVALTDGADNEEREPDVRYRWSRPAGVAS
jgi:GNAT superfamily N-acetyltransferase